MKLGHDFHSCKFAQPVPNPNLVPVKIYKKKDNSLMNDSLPKHLPSEKTSIPIAKNTKNNDPFSPNVNQSSSAQQPPNHVLDKTTSAEPPPQSHLNPHPTTSPDKVSSSNKETAYSSSTATSPEAMHASFAHNETEASPNPENVIICLTSLNRLPQKHLIFQLPSILFLLEVQ